MFNTARTYQLIHVSSQTALQAPNQYNYNKTSLELGPINQRNNNQMWIIELKQKDRYQIILGFPDVVLTADGTDVTLKKGKGDKAHQYWVFDNSDPNGLKIMQFKHDNCYLGVNKGDNSHRIIIKKNPPQNQIDLWRLFEVTKNTDLNRCCYIRSTKYNKLMDVPASQGNEGVHICVWDANYRFNQRWKIYRAGQVFIIKSYKTDLNLDIAGEKYENNAKLIQWHSTGGNNQFWKFQERDKDTYRISSWFDPSLQIGTDGKYLYLHQGHSFTWKVEGHIPEL